MIRINTEPGTAQTLLDRIKRWCADTKVGWYSDFNFDGEGDVTNTQGAWFRPVVDENGISFGMVWHAHANKREKNWIDFHRDFYNFFIWWCRGEDDVKSIEVFTKPVEGVDTEGWWKD